MNRNRSIVIADRRIGIENAPFIIAEMSGNHNHSLARALEIVDAAAEAGAHALKLQTYTADTLTLDCRSAEFFVNDSGSLWQGRSLYDLYRDAHTPWEWHKPIFDRCREHGLIGFSTPFDETAVAFLESLDVPCYKIASFENIHLPLIRTVAATGKPIIMSTGMASVAELDEAVTMIRTSGGNDIVLLKCTSTYPATPESTNVRTIPHMRELFDVQVGLSDHTMGNGTAICAVALGATIIEKHFTLNRADGGVDAAFSLEPDELKLLVQESEHAWQSLGAVSYGPTDAEKASLLFRRSIYVAEDMQAGETFTQENLRVVRPGHGLAPKYLDLLLGHKSSRNISRGTPMSWELVLHSS
jgi:N-acetylneuraminate synthase